MSTIHTTQQTIQLLLATSEYVGALDLIATTQEILAKEMTGIHCFRYLGTQLSEIEKVIDKMLVEDFTGYAQADLSRPIEVAESLLSMEEEKDLDYPGIGFSLEGGREAKEPSPKLEVGNDFYGGDSLVNAEEPLVMEEDRLVALILGMLRLEKYNFIDIYKTEIASCTKSLIRDTVREQVEKHPVEIETLPDQDPSVACLADEMRLMTFAQWLPLMDVIFKKIVVFLRRVKAVHNVMCDVVRVAVGKPHLFSAEASLRSPAPLPRRRSKDTDTDLSTSSLLLPIDTSVTLDMSDEDFIKLQNRLRDLLWFACDHAQDRCIKVIASRAKGGYMDKIGSSDFVLLCKMVESFASACERICGRRGTALRSSLTSQAARFVNRFHEERKTKLSLILDSERWKLAEVPAEFQQMADEAFQTGDLLPMPPVKIEPNKSPPPQTTGQYLRVKGEMFAVVGTVLLLMRMMADYCKCVRDIPTTVPEVLTKLVELLKTFNSRTCQLVMGAGALQLVGLKTISTKNLALASRSLQLALLLVSLIKRKYIDSWDSPSEEMNGVAGSESKPTSSSQLLGLTKTRRLTLTRQFNQLEKDYTDHIQLIHNKLVNIVETMLERDLESWEAKAPVPSPCFRNIGKQLAKFHEAIVDLLPKSQIQTLFTQIHDVLLNILRKDLKKQGIKSDGGPKHGLVMTELAFYLENLKSMNGLDCSHFETQTIWVES